MQLDFNHQVLRFHHAQPDLDVHDSDSLTWLDSASIGNHGDIFVFDRFQPKGKLEPLGGDDETGLECSLNHFHVSCSNAQEAVGTAIIIFAKVLALWQRSFAAETGRIRQIASIAPIDDKTGRFELSYRFHLIRNNQSWLAADLDRYEEAILVSE